MADKPKPSGSQQPDPKKNAAPKESQRADDPKKNANPRQVKGGHRPPDIR